MSCSSSALSAKIPISSAYINKNRFNLNDCCGTLFFVTKPISKSFTQIEKNTGDNTSLAKHLFGFIEKLIKHF